MQLVLAFPDDKKTSIAGRPSEALFISNTKVLLPSRHSPEGKDILIYGDIRQIFIY
jgi:hypothetical protein